VCAFWWKALSFKKRGLGCRTESLPAKVRLAFRLDADEWQGVRRVRFLVEAAEL